MSVNAPYTAYVMDVSYFSGKFEAYLRYKEIPYQRVEASWWQVSGLILAATGLAKVPVVRTAEGEWLQDTTPMIDWFEARHPEGAVLPDDPYQAFFCRLLEDYADEWLWRPALHYRWSFPTTARLASRRIAREVLRIPPTALTAIAVRRRQYKHYVAKDGVTAATRVHVEGIYLGTLDRLERLLADRPYLLGDRPSLADFGFFGSMFRHFSLDPTPARIMRDRAPGVYAWVARLWRARCSQIRGDWHPAGELPEVWHEILRDAGGGYLPYLHANAIAWREGREQFDLSVQGAHYRELPVVHYRVWCRERLQDHFEALPEAARRAVRKTLEDAGAWEPLWADGRIPSHLHEGGNPPVCSPGEPAGPRRALLARRDPWNHAPASLKRRRES